MTQQRLAVFRELAKDASHPSIETLYARLQRHLPSLSLATVYRVLASLESERLVRRLNLEEGGARFDANIEPHQHLVCRVCDSIADVEVPSLARLDLDDLSTGDFTQERLDIRIVGVCAECTDES